MNSVQFATLFPHIPLAKHDRFCMAIDAAAEEYSIQDVRRKAAFLAQIGHETGGLRWLEELGSSTYFTARYEGREDLGNTLPGDGALYHGRGLIQLTGRANYRTVGKALGLSLEAEPERAAEVEVGARIAGHYWKSHGCNELADTDRFTAITKRINGGVIGLEDRLARWDKAREVFGLAAIRER